MVGMIFPNEQTESDDHGHHIEPLTVEHVYVAAFSRHCVGFFSSASLPLLLSFPLFILEGDADMDSTPQV